MTIGGSEERRGASRFPLQEPLFYRVIQARSDRPTGMGRTLDMSSSGICFTTETALPPGKMVEISVEWPAQLDGVCPLKFVAVGRVVRADSTVAAMRIERYEFRTRGAATLAGARALYA